MEIKEVWETWPRDVVHALRCSMMDADEKFGADNESGTKTFVREYLIPEMARRGLTLTLSAPAPQTEEEK